MYVCITQQLWDLKQKTHLTEQMQSFAFKISVKHIHMTHSLIVLVIVTVIYMHVFIIVIYIYACSTRREGLSGTFSQVIDTGANLGQELYIL